MYIDFLYKNRGFAAVLPAEEIAMSKIVLREEYIKLGQALKAVNLVESGVEAKIVILEGKVKVNGQVEVQRGKKLYDGDVVSYQGETIEIVK